jgi:hypothetical protein
MPAADELLAAARIWGSKTMFTMADMRSLMKAVPFVPFRLHMSIQGRW